MVGMNEFLMELYGEEIPPSAQFLGESELKDSIEKLLVDKKINYSKIQTFSTPRRITVVVSNLKKQNNEKIKEIRGPSTQSNEIAVKGFLRSQGIKNEKDLIKKKIKDKEYYFFKQKVVEKNIIEILAEEIPIILSSIRWKKSMRWSSIEEKWSRPIRNILCIFNRKVIKFTFAGINTNSYTFPNYHYSLKKIKCEDFKFYRKALEENYVILDSNDRQKQINQNLEKFCKKKKVKLNKNEELIRRVADSVEWPNLFFGSFEKNNYRLPEFLITTIISEKQDNFTFKKEDGELSNYFGFVSNVELKYFKNLVIGNLAVLKARFKDAEFFIEEDKKKTFSERLEKLSSIIFYDNLGTLRERAERIQRLCQILAKLNKISIDENLGNLLFSNVDLSTELVKEYPSLQGNVGGFYANLFGMNKELCDAISNQYKFNCDEKKINLSLVLMLSQKFDSFFGFFFSKKKISGSGDPFGVRRTVLSIINVLIEMKISLDFSKIFEVISFLYKSQGIEVDSKFSSIVEFSNKRFTNFLLEKGFDLDLIRSALEDKEFNPFELSKKINLLDVFLKTKIGKDFFKSYKRLNSILKEDDISMNVDKTLFEKKDEARLHSDVIILNKHFSEKKAKINNNLFANISKSINNFLDNVIVNSESQKVRKNRVALLIECKKAINLFFTLPKA